jgi:3-oxo-5-alpha-steroid 4-dehydrogenase 1
MDEQSIVRYSSIGMIVLSAIAFIAEVLGLSVPYGRYAQSAGKVWGFKVSARTAWVLMESPTLYTMGYMLLQGRQACTENRVNMMLVLMFVIHYINRSLIFPFRMAQGAPMPISVMFMAFFYCFWNGCTQGLYLSTVHAYP